MDKTNFLRHFVMKQNGIDQYMIDLQQQVFKECISPCNLLIQVRGFENKIVFCL